MKSFFVTGLPRSRTAWCSAWLTTDKTLCLHDSIDMPALVDRIVGYAGPELVKEYGSAWAGDSPWLVILRDSEVCKASFLRVAGPQPEGFEKFWADRVEAINSLQGRPGVKVILFENLDDEQKARAAWNHLLPFVDFDPVRYKTLCGMNIQQKGPK